MRVTMTLKTGWRSTPSPVLGAKGRSRKIQAACTWHVVSASSSSAGFAWVTLESIAVKQAKVSATLLKMSRKQVELHMTWLIEIRLSVNSSVSSTILCAISNIRNRLCMLSAHANWSKCKSLKLLTWTTCTAQRTISSSSTFADSLWPHVVHSVTLTRSGSTWRVHRSKLSSISSKVIWRAH